MDAINKATDMSLADLGKERTAAMRKWTLRAQEIRKSPDPQYLPSGKRKKILEDKSLQLLHEMIKEAEYPDDWLPFHRRDGFNLLGPIPPSGCFPKKPMVATLAPHEVLENSAETRRAIVHAASSSRDVEMDRELMRITNEELEKGWLEGPFPISEISAGATLTRRFGVRQFSTSTEQGRVSKTRPIDDFTESLVNLTNSCDETIAPHGIDFVLAALSHRFRRCKEAKRKVELLLRTIDLRKAYKQLPLSDSAAGTTFICIRHPDSGKVLAYRVLVLPFGARSAVQSFYRSSHCLWYLGCCLFSLHWSLFFDDYILGCSKEEERLVDLTQSAFFTLTGWAVSHEKDKGFSTLAKALGVEISLCDLALGVVHVCNTQGRKDEVKDQIDTIIRQKGARGSTLASLRGRLLFAESQVFGRRAAQEMKVLGGFCDVGGWVKMNDRLETALSFLRDKIISGPPRSLSLRSKPLFHIYSDACREPEYGGVGGMLFHPGGHVVSWFGAKLGYDEFSHLAAGEIRETLIYELELAACVLSLQKLLPKGMPCEVICFLDNDAALSGLISGKAGSVGVRPFLRSLSALESSVDITLWFERVASHSNPADAPSRGDFTHLPSDRRISFEPSWLRAS